MSSRPQRIRKKKRFADEDYEEPNPTSQNEQEEIVVKNDPEESDTNDYKSEDNGTDNEGNDDDVSERSRRRRSSRLSNSRYSPDPKTKGHRQELDEYGRMKRSRGRPRKDDPNDYAPPKAKKKNGENEADPAMKQRIFDILKDAKEANQRQVEETSHIQDDIKDDLLNLMDVSHPQACPVSSSRISTMSPEDREARVRAKIRQIQGYTPRSFQERDQAEHSQKPRLYKDYLREIGREPNTPTPPGSPPPEIILQEDNIKREEVDILEDPVSSPGLVEKGNVSANVDRNIRVPLQGGVRYLLRKQRDGTLIREPVPASLARKIVPGPSGSNGLFVGLPRNPGSRGYVNPNAMLDKIRATSFRTIQRPEIRPYIRKLPIIGSTVPSTMSSQQNKFIVTNSVKTMGTPTGIGPLRRPTLTHVSKPSPAIGPESAQDDPNFIQVSEEHMGRLKYISMRISLLKDERSRLMRAQQALFNQLNTNETIGSLVRYTQGEIPFDSHKIQDQRVKDHTVLRTKSDKISNRISQITMEIEELMKESMNCMSQVPIESTG